MAFRLATDEEMAEEKKAVIVGDDTPRDVSEAFVTTMSGVGTPRDEEEEKEKRITREAMLFRKDEFYDCVEIVRNPSTEDNGVVWKSICSWKGIRECVFQTDSLSGALLLAHQRSFTWHDHPHTRPLYPADNETRMPEIIPGMGAIHEDRHQTMCDCVKIFIRPRWKSSEASGDEWRQHWIAQMLRGGKLVGEELFCESIKDALIQVLFVLKFGPSVVKELCDKQDYDNDCHGGRPRFGRGTTNQDDPEETPKTIYCQQLSCRNLATVCYRMKKVYFDKTNSYGMEVGPDAPPLKDHYYQPAFYRFFCEEHKERGDCGLEDADDNYVEITNEEEIQKIKCWY